MPERQCERYGMFSLPFRATNTLVVMAAKAKRGPDFRPS